MFNQMTVTADLVDLVPFKIASLDENSTYRWVSKNFADYLQVPREEIMGRKSSEILPVIEGPDDLLNDRAMWLTKVIDGGVPVDYHITVQHPNTGELRYFKCRAVPNTDARIVFIFFQDETENRESADRQAKFEAIFDGTSEGMVVMNPSGTITMFNSASERMFGYAREEIIGKPVTTLMPAAIAAVHHKFVQRYMDQPDEPKLVNTHKTIEGDCVRKDGTTFPADLGVAKFEAGGKTYFTALIRDISDRKQHEQQAKEWNENLEAEVAKRGRALDQIFNLTDDILAILSFDGHFVSVSPSAERVTGIPVERALAEQIPYYAFAVEEDREDLVRLFSRVCTGEQVTGYEFRVRHSVRGDIRWTSWNVRPVMEDRTILLVGRDITEEREREAALRQSQKMEAIGQLTGGIAHDFNNLLMGISGCVDMMESRLAELQEREVRKYIDGAQSSVKRAAALTHRLLAFSRRQPLSPTVVDVNKLIRGMEHLISGAVGSGVEVICTLGDDIGLVTCDPNQLETAILNLVNNARDALPDGIGQVIIRTEDQVTLGVHSVRLSVIDYGSGMSDEVRARAFDPFFTTKPIGQGTGLGLSMLYGFVNQSGGSVDIETASGKGTSVHIGLPVTEDAVAEDSYDITETLPPIIRPTTKRVLIVEDEPVIRELMVDALRDLGHETHAVGDGCDAVKSLTALNFDILVTDVGLPGLNGRQVANAARELHPNMHILFVTGYAAGITQRKELCNGGSSDLLLKPFTINSLKDKVSEMLKQQALG